MYNRRSIAIKYTGNIIAYSGMVFPGFKATWNKLQRSTDSKGKN